MAINVAALNFDRADIPKGAITFFNSTACPAGWSVYSAAIGRYFVSSETSIPTTVGTALSALEDRHVGLHPHAFAAATHTHGMPFGTTELGGGLFDADMSGTLTTQSSSVNTTGVTVNSTGALPGTNGPYIVYLPCKKD